MAFAVGDTVLLSGSYRTRLEPRAVTVTKVGRKYVYVDGVQTGFRIEDGVAADGFGNMRLQTREEHDRNVAAADARKALRNFGLEVHYSMSAETVLAVYEALRPLMGPPPGGKGV